MQSQIACSLLALLLQLLAVFLPCLLASVPPPRPGFNPDPNP